MAEVLPPVIAAMPVEDLSFHETYAAMQIRQNLSEIQNDIKALPKADISSLAAIKDSLYDGNDTQKSFDVCIVGAGVAGLFTAMIFDHLKKEYELDVNYEIIEANGPDRVGGRLYSYVFPNCKDDEHQYYDVGAMRFPNTTIMKRTFELFNELEMTKVCQKVVTDADKETVRTAKNGLLIPYKLSSTTTPNLYNGVRVLGPDASANAFKIQDIPLKFRDKNPDTMVTEHIQKFLDVYKTDGPEEFWKTLMQKGDKYTVRQYLYEHAGYNYKTVEFLETLNFGNRWYDQAFSEMVCETLDFDAKPEEGWFCVMGGSQQTAYRMRDKIGSGKITFKKAVNRVGYISKPDPNTKCLEVGFVGNDPPKQYHAVFNSAPLGAQQHMDLDLLNLNWGTKQAIRNLGYGASCKIGIRFKTMWWMAEGCNDGGVAKTDLSIRACVYPSYNLYDKQEEPGVLLASYTWSAEAEKIGALIDRNSPNDEEELKELLYHDLALLHAKTGDRKDYDRLYKIIKENYMDHFAYNWYSDKRQVGAFAFFGCGQFSNMYQWITRTDGNYVIIGEVASAHHAWVVGALESAVRGVYQFLFMHSKNSEAAHKALTAYNNKEVPLPYGPLPAEYNRTKDIKYMTRKGVNVESSPEGELARQQVMVEAVRQEQEHDQIEARDVKGDQIVGFFQAELLNEKAPETDFITLIPPNWP